MCTQLGLQLFIRAADFPLQQLAFDIRRISYRAKIFYFSGCVVVVFSRTKLWYTADPFLSSFITLYPLFYISYTTHETHKTRHMPGPGKVNERPRPLAFAGARWLVVGGSRHIWLGVDTDRRLTPGLTVN